MVMDQTSKEYHLQDVSEAKAQRHSPGPPNAQRKRPRLHIGPRVRDGRVGSPTLVVLVVVGRRRRGSHVSAVLHFREMQSNWGRCLLGGGLKQKKGCRTLIGMQAINLPLTQINIFAIVLLTDWRMHRCGVITL